MGLNRMMMKSNIFLKDIEAEMVVGYSDVSIGFMEGLFGKLLPNPLPNGVHVYSVYCDTDKGKCVVLPATIKSCTFEAVGITITHDEAIPDGLINYLSTTYSNAPITLHF